MAFELYQRDSYELTTISSPLYKFGQWLQSLQSVEAIIYMAVIFFVIVIIMALCFDFGTYYGKYIVKKRARNVFVEVNV